MRPGSLLLRHCGERADGHDFVDVAEAKGNVGALVQNQRAVSDLEFGVILVESTTDALGLLASDYLSRTGVDVIGITGSVGKTSTKDLVSAVLN